MAQGPGIQGATDRIVRFGPFEADLAAGELRKRGRPVRIQEQPFQVLAVLLERPGEVVTREQIRERLWRDDTFVDFDQGLNTAINKLRDALQDSAGAPQYVETLPKRGYRLICPVELPPSPEAEMETPVSANKPDRRWLAALLLLGAAGLVFWLGALSSPDDTSVEAPFRRFGIDPPDSLALQMPWQQTLVLSPDGRRIAGLMGGQLWIFNFDQGEWSSVEGSNGARMSMLWSPDSGRVAFVAGNELRVVSVEAGAMRTICRLPDGSFFGGSWSPDGEIILFSSNAPPNLYEVAAAGGEPRVALTFAQIEEQIRSETERQLPANWLTYPSFLPLGNGRRVILFGVGRGSAGSSIALHDFGSGETKILAEGSSPVYSTTGHLLYLQPRIEPSRAAYDIVAQPFSLDRLQTSGSPFPVVQGGLSPTVARDGTLAYLDAPAFQLTFVDRTGAKLRDVGPVAMGYHFPALSPDGNTVAVEVQEGENQDIWTMDLGRDVRLRISDSPETEILPVWSPSGEELAFGSYRSGISKMFIGPADGSAAEREISLETQQPDRIGDWSRDGQTIVYSTLHPDTGQDIWALVRSGGDKWERQPFLITSQNERSPKLSPDGRYLAYLSDETGRFEVYLQPFPNGGRKWPISSGGGAAQIRWRRDGQELFFSEAGQMMAVSVQLIPTLKLGAPQRLFTHQLHEALDPNYDVTADGSQFLMALEATAKRKVRIIQNWQAGF